MNAVAALLLCGVAVVAGQTTYGTTMGPGGSTQNPGNSANALIHNRLLYDTGACTGIDKNATPNAVAVPAAYWNANGASLCGKCVMVTAGSKSMKATIYDKWTGPEILLSWAVFNALAPSCNGNALPAPLAVTFTQVAC